MREQLDALVSELRRLRRDGVSRVVVSDESLASLKALAASAKASSPESDRPAEPVAAKAPARPVAAAQAAPTPAPATVTSSVTEQPFRTVGISVVGEPGQQRTVELVAFAGDRVVIGFRQDVMGAL